MSFGLYLHVPYCRTICPYCDFNVARAKNVPWPRFTEQLKREISLRSAHFLGQSLATIYWGGGTPSLMPAECIADVHEHITSLFGAAEREVSMEANPGTLNRAELRAFMEAGINRISLGAQSTSSDNLVVLGRDHRHVDTQQAIYDAKAIGFKNISIDLIFALPGQSLASLDLDLSFIVGADLQHVSLYALTYHEKTPFFRRREKGEIVAVEEELELLMMRQIREQLLNSGFCDYEVSNYGKADFYSEHNSGYWRGDACLAVGPGAHGVFCTESGAERWETMRSPGRYLKWDDDVVPNEWCESLSVEDLALERVATGVRTQAGFLRSEPRLKALPQEFWERCDAAVERGWLIAEDEGYRPTVRGRELADALAEFLLF